MSPQVEMDPERAKRELIAVLQRAHAGEMGAALAYDGHWRSLDRLEEIRAVQSIEREELDHRLQLGDMLNSLGGDVSPSLERLMRLIGGVIGRLCRVGGWLAPMYGAGWLERGNVREYENAARFAVLAAEAGYARELLAIAEVEWEHERYFRSRVEEHWISRWIPLWEAPAPRERIQESFELFLLFRGELQRIRRAA